MPLLLIPQGTCACTQASRRPLSLPFCSETTRPNAPGARLASPKSGAGKVDIEMNRSVVVSLYAFLATLNVVFSVSNQAYACEERYSPSAFKAAPTEVLSFLSEGLTTHWLSMTTQDIRKKYRLTSRGSSSGSYSFYSKTGGYTEGLQVEYCETSGVCSIWGKENSFPQTITITKVLPRRYFSEDVFRAFRSKFSVNLQGCLSGTDADIGTGLCQSDTEGILFRVGQKYLSLALRATGILDSGHENKKVPSTHITYTVRDLSGNVNSYVDCRKALEDARKAGRNLNL